MMEVVIRAATAADAATIVRLLRALAEYEDLLDQVKIDAAAVLRDGFGERRYFECLLAEVAGAAVGLAVFYHTYSTFEGRPELYVEDIVVDQAARGQGVGRALMARLAALALERNCFCLDLAVLHWNPARDFYRRLGFRHVEDWLPYRLDGEGLRRLAAAEDRGHADGV
jgi:ribosomal protein S18 acetylase RimI-like enzyme